VLNLFASGTDSSALLSPSFLNKSMAGSGVGRKEGERRALLSVPEAKRFNT